MKYKIILIVIGVSTLLYFIQNSLPKIIEEGYKDFPFINLKSHIPTDYLTVMNLDSNDIGYVHNAFKKHSVVSSFDYQDEFIVTVLKVSLSSKSKDLNTIVKSFNDLNSLGSCGDRFVTGMNAQLVDLKFTFDYPLLKVDSVEIHIPRSGVINTILERDSLCAYFMPDSYGYSVRLNQQKYFDMAVKVVPPSIFQKQEDKINMLLVLKQKDGFLYFYLITKMNFNTKDIEANVFNDFFDYK